MNNGSRRRLSRRTFLATSAMASALALRAPRLGGEESDREPGPLRAGAATSDITPEVGVSLNGLLQMLGPIKEIHDPLQARCLALDNGQTRLAIVLCDMCLISDSLIEQAKSIAAEKTNLAKDRILIAATHTHMAPRMAGWVGGALDRRYYKEFPGRVAQAVSQAVSNLAPAQVGTGKVDKAEFLANRRWIMKPGTIGPNPFGERGDRVVMGGQPAKHRDKPAGPVDPELSILSARHSDGRPLALLGNYGLHTGIFRNGVASADYFGEFSEQVGSLLSPSDSNPAFVGMMSNGASGDVGPLGGDFRRVKAVSAALAKDAVRVSKRIDYHARPALAMQESVLQIDVRKPTPQQLKWAESVQQDPAAKLPHKWSRHFAKEIQHMAEFPDQVEIKLQAIRIGDLGIVAIPCEVFAETGLAIKQASPLPSTMVISHANAWHGYLPTPAQHDLGGMEVWLRRGSYLARDASNQIQAESLRMLNQVAEEA